MKEKKDSMDFFSSLPSLESKLDCICSFLRQEQYLPVISLDLENTIEVQELYDSAMYNIILQVLQKQLSFLKGSELRKEDIVVSNMPLGKKIYIFLSRGRSSSTHLELGQLEKIALRLIDYLYGKLFRMFYQLTAKPPQLKAGYSFCFYSSHFEPTSLIQFAIEEAEDFAPYLTHKYNLIKKASLYDFLQEQKLKFNFQPIFHLGLVALVGYDIQISWPVADFAHSTFNLAQYACETGLPEYQSLLNNKLLKEMVNLEVDKYLFFPLDFIFPLDKLFYLNELQVHLQAYGFSAEKLIFGIDELALLANRDLLSIIFNQFSKNYFYVELSGLTQEADWAFLQDERIRFLKLNKDWWPMLVTSFQDKLSSLISFAHSNNKTVFLGGINYKEQLDLARSLHFDLGSGEFFQKNESLPQIVELNSAFLEEPGVKKQILISIYLKRGREYFNRRDYDKAVLEFSKVIELDPGNCQAYFYRGFSFCEEGVFSIAYKDLSKLKELDNSYPYILLLEARLLEKHHELVKAKEFYRQFLENAQLPLWESEMIFAQQRFNDLKG